MLNVSSSEVPFSQEGTVDENFQKSEMQSDYRIFSRSQYIQEIQKQPAKITSSGMEPLLQQTFSGTRVKRDEVTKKVVKNLAVDKMNEKEKKGAKVIISMQQLNPDYETLSVTPSYLSSPKDVVHEEARPKLHMEYHELAKMVKEESQDVENILKIVPPDLPLREDRYALKQRVQRLRLNAESVMFLEESIINHTPTADEAIVETPPEVLACIMHTVESGVAPECPPDQIFHTLFEETSTEHSIVLSSVSPGLLQDVLVPQQLAKEIHKESVTAGLINLIDIYKNVSEAEDWPAMDVFNVVMDDAARKPSKEHPTVPFKPLQNEEMPWADEDLEPIVNIVGAEPAIVLQPAYVPDLESSGNLESVMSRGIEYFVEADPVQYISKVQLRGSQPPTWFPGYILALPEFPGVVKLARNPDEVFTSSWKSCHPKLIPDESISILH
ncbi:uncharacterized protein [Euwallacea fornicatus]|uniref:uncharacterized protein n=1 Tax=Euwallacea fornicatus TaxID=995702 RepID=UPI00338F4D61